MKYVFHPEAEAEFFAAKDYYKVRDPGLGYDFAVEVHSTIENILIVIADLLNLPGLQDLAGLNIGQALAGVLKVHYIRWDSGPDNRMFTQIQWNGNP